MTPPSGSQAPVPSPPAITECGDRIGKWVVFVKSSIELFYRHLVLTVTHGHEVPNKTNKQKVLQTFPVVFGWNRRA